jgi:membrane associated rhomboid family serine protease
MSNPPNPLSPQDSQGAGSTPGADPQSGTAVPTCYRHPGRETYVSCVRCGRPACPDCLRSAAVGQQCVECIREGNRTTRRPAGRFGGQARAGQPIVTWTLVAINVVLYLFQLARPGLANDWAMLGLARLGPGGPVAGVAAGQWYRLITAAFLPGSSGLGVLDIAFNMWALILVGPAVEQVLGRARYLAVYVVSALGGSVVFYFLAPANEPALGASGAIFGLFGAWFVLSRRLRVDSRQVVILIVINLVISFVFRSTIAWQAHIGGLVAGGLITAAYAYAPRQNRALIQAAATLAILAILVVGVVTRDHQLVGAVRL